MAESVEPAVAPAAGNPRFPLVDAMRGIAASMVILSHLPTGDVARPWFARLTLGVTLFFLISGFLLYRPFVAARMAGGREIGLGGYLRRRSLRIVPAYWVALTVLGLWPGLAGLWDGDWWRYYTFTQIYAPATILNGIPPAWSLSVEVSFYLVLPVVAAGLGALTRGLPRRRAVRRELLALAGIAVASLAFQAYVHPRNGIAANTLPAYLDWFAYGMALAVVSVALEGRETRSRVLRHVAAVPWSPWLLALLAFWVLTKGIGLPDVPFVPYPTTTAIAEHLLQPACAALLLLPALFAGSAGGWPRRLLAWRPLGWLGLISYGVFLYHVPLLGQLRSFGAEDWIPGSKMVSLGLLTLGASVAVATVSYLLVERPALRLKGGRGRGPTAGGAQRSPRVLAATGIVEALGALPPVIAPPVVPAPAPADA